MSLFTTPLDISRTRLDALYAPAPPRLQQDAPRAALPRRASVSDLAATMSGERRRSVTALAGAAMSAAASGAAPAAHAATSAGAAAGAGAGAGAAPAAEEADAGDLRLRRLTAAVSKQQGFLMERDIEALSAQTGYSRPELYARFIRFKALCALGGTPTGVNRATFRRHVPFLAVEDELFVSRVFDLLDGDGAQLLDWDKYLLCMSALDAEVGATSRQLRTEFLFKVVDREGSGSITVDKLFESIAASLRLDAASGRSAAAAPPGAPSALTAEAEAILRDFSGRFFRELDAAGAGSVTLPQVQQYVAAHDEIADVGSVFGRAMVLGMRGDTGTLLREAEARQKAKEAATEAKRLSTAAAAAGGGGDSARRRGGEGDDFENGGGGEGKRQQ